MSKVNEEFLDKELNTYYNKRRELRSAVSVQRLTREKRQAILQHFQQEQERLQAKYDLLLTEYIQLEELSKHKEGVDN